MMVFMTAQLPLPVTMDPVAVSVGLAVSLMENDHGGEVYIRGQLCDVWDAEDTAARRWAAVKLVRLGAASQEQIAAESPSDKHEQKELVTSRKVLESL